MKPFLQLDPLLLLFSLLEVLALWFYIRKLGSPRLSQIQAYALLAAVALFQTIFLNNIAFYTQNDFYNTHHFSFVFLQLGLLFLCIWSIRRVHWDQALYHALVISLIPRYFEHALGDVTVYLDIFYLSLTNPIIYRVLGCLLVFLLYLTICLLLPRFIDMKGTATIQRSRLALLGVFALALEMINFVTVQITAPRLPLPYLLALALLELMCGFTALIFIVYNETLLQKAREQSELNQIRLLMEKQAQQYKQQQSITSSIDRKYHDLKHHLDALKVLKASEARFDYIAELESGIRNYEATCNTGNEILDIILNEKLFYCSQHNIQLILMVSGEAVSFVQTTDLVAIFSNAIDNAIEAVSTLNDPALREIIVRAAVRNNWTVLRFENHCNHPLLAENGILRTTKEDASIHGFGFKSIAHAAKNYGGHCTYSLDGDLFVLNILLACPKNETLNRQD
jgi:hypothetical protein